MSKSQQEPPNELENQFILRLPPEHASKVREMIRSGSAAVKDKLKFDLSSDGSHAIVEVEDVSLNAKLVDLPCVIESLKTLDKKTFYKTADISKMLVCTADGDHHSSLEEPVAPAHLNVVTGKNKERQKNYTWKHGITPPLKNLRKKKFHKTTKKVNDLKQVEEVRFSKEKDSLSKHSVLNDNTGILPSHTVDQYIDSPDVKKEVKRLMYADAEAISARWEVIAEGEDKEIESQGFIPSFEISPGTSGYEQGHNSAGTLIKAKQEFQRGYGMFRERLISSTSSSDDEDSDKDDDDEVDYYYYEDEETHREENLQRELQAKLIEFGQYGSKERASSIILEIQNQIHYFEKKLVQIQCKEQRQKNIIRKVENLTLKNHLHSMLQRLKLQEKEKNDQISYLQEKLKYFLEKQGEPSARHKPRIPHAD